MLDDELGQRTTHWKLEQQVSLKVSPHLRSRPAGKRRDIVSTVRVVQPTYLPRVDLGASQVGKTTG